MDAESFLCLGGNEVANSMRVMSYLLRGLGGSQFSVPATPANPESVVVGYDDIYDDIYEPAASYASHLECSCDELDDETNYVSPAEDPAPWYDEMMPASGEFLGVMFDAFDLGTGGLRSVAARASGGGTLSRLRVKPRILAVHGHLYAASARGMAYGKRWVNKALAGSMCGDCGGDTAEILPACGDGFRTLYEVGLVDGPVFAAIPGVPGCTMQEVSFQLAAGNPYLHRSHGEMLEPVDLTETYQYATQQIETSEWTGDVSITIEVTAVGIVNGLQIFAVPMAPGAPCADNPVTVMEARCAYYQVDNLADGDRLIIDATSRRVERWDNTSKTVTSGFANLAFDSPFPWLVVSPCSNVCLSFVNGAGHAIINVSHEEREL